MITSDIYSCLCVLNIFGNLNLVMHFSVSTNKYTINLVTYKNAVL